MRQEFEFIIIDMNLVISKCLYFEEYPCNSECHSCFFVIFVLDHRFYSSSKSFEYLISALGIFGVRNSNNLRWEHLNILNSSYRNYYILLLRPTVPRCSS